MSTGRSEGLERRCFAIAGVSFAALAAYGVGAARAQDCESLVGKAYGDATVSAATNVTPPFSVTGKDPPTPVSVDAPFCRVEGTIKPSADSDIKFEVWLPPEGSWNGKYQGVGNGGFAGSLIYAPMSWALEAGYAVSGTDTGHSGGTLDADWALGHPEKIVDFGWRAIHLTALASKAIVADYYGTAPRHAYFSGCSDGGREALMEAQRFPQDYDGIVAGAPASDWTKLLANAVWSEQAVDPANAWLSPEKLSIGGGGEAGGRLVSDREAEGSTRPIRISPHSRRPAASSSSIMAGTMRRSRRKPRSTITSSVANEMGGLQNLRSFYRLFMAPGMEHCGLGPGPSAVGGVFGLPSPSRDPAHDVVAALAHWVENGAAPDFLVATRYLNNDPAKGLEAQRPWCPYPTAARFLGEGDRSEAASYACSAQP